MAGDLKTFVGDVMGVSFSQVENDYGDGFVRLRVSEAQRRQAKQDIRCVEDALIELLRNARDAHARTIFVATARSGALRTVTVIDDGDGIPSHMHERVFEPRVTSKLDTPVDDEWGVHGRGMALYSIAQNAYEASVVASLPGQGTAMRVVFRIGDITERKDQSTLPRLIAGENATWTLGAGPHNMARAAAAFALSTHETCRLYWGSPAEIAQALCTHGERLIGQGLPAGLAGRFAMCSDADSLVEVAAASGLSVSRRSAYRALKGECAVLRPFFDELTDAACARCEKHAPDPGDMRGLKIAAADMGAFVSSLNRAWEGLAESYYLEPSVEPSVRVTRDGIHVVFPVAKRL